MTEMIVAAGRRRSTTWPWSIPIRLEPVQQITGPSLALVAVKFGDTRLIDNAILECDGLTSISDNARSLCLLRTRPY